MGSGFDDRHGAHGESLRYFADYETDSLLREDAQEVVQQAEAFVAALRSLVLRGAQPPT